MTADASYHANGRFELGQRANPTLLLDGVSALVRATFPNLRLGKGIQKFAPTKRWTHIRQRVAVKARVINLGGGWSAG